MATVKINLPTEMMAKISTLGNKTDEIIEKALIDGAKAVLPIVKGELQSVIANSPRSTGELVSSLGISKVDVDYNGVSNIKVGFAEPREEHSGSRQKTGNGKYNRTYYTRTNAMIANVLEYGKSNQPPRPFMKRAKAKSRTLARKAIKRRIEEEIERII